MHHIKGNCWAAKRGLLREADRLPGAIIGELRGWQMPITRNSGPFMTGQAIEVSCIPCAFELGHCSNFASAGLPVCLP